MSTQEAYEEGYDAYWAGLDSTDNPYEEEEEADARLAWEQGWRRAREHDYDERD